MNIRTNFKAKEGPQEHGKSSEEGCRRAATRSRRCRLKPHHDRWKLHHERRTWRFYPPRFRSAPCRSARSSSTWASPAPTSWSTSGSGWRWTTRASGTPRCCARSCPGGATAWYCQKATKVKCPNAFLRPPGPLLSSASSSGCRRGTSGPARPTCRRRRSRTGSTTPWRMTTMACRGMTSWPSGSTGYSGARTPPCAGYSRPATRGSTIGSFWTASCLWWTTGSR